MVTIDTEYKPPSTIQDNFTNESIGDMWDTSTPVGSVTETGGTLNISIGSGVNGDWWSGSAEYAPIIYTPLPAVYEEFEAIIKITSFTMASNKNTGLMLYLDRDNVFLFGPHESNIKVEKIVGGTGTGTVASASSSTIPVWLKIRDDGTNYYFDYSTDGSSYTNVYSTSSLGFTPSSVGMFAKNWGSKPATSVSFDDFYLTYTTIGVPCEAVFNDENYNDWLWQNEIEITGSVDGQLTNYPVLITVPYDEEFMNFDFSDIRFGTDYGLNLPYFLRRKVDGDFAEFFISVPVIEASPAVTLIYLYAGNDDALMRSNGREVFSFFDDFDEGYTPTLDTTKWTLSYNGGYEASISNSILTLKSDLPIHYTKLTSKSSFGQNYILGVKAKVSVPGGGNDYASFGFDDDSTRYIKEYFTNTESKFVVNDAGSEDTGSDHDSTYDPEEYHVYEMQNKPTGGISEDIDFTDVEDSTVNISTAMPVEFKCFAYGTAQFIYVDYVYVRHSIDNDVSLGELGTWSTTTHTGIYQATAVIPYSEQYQALACIRPLRADFQALASITGQTEALFKLMATVKDNSTNNYIYLYQMLANIKADANNFDALCTARIGNVTDGSLEVHGKILYNYDRNTSAPTTIQDNNMTFVINLGGRIYG